MTDYLSMLKAKANTPEVKQHGIKGMRWGIRRTDRQIAKDTLARKSSGEKITNTQKAAALTAHNKPSPQGSESASSRYARLASEAKGGGAKSWSEDDLRFFNSRTEALKKVERMFAPKESWLKTTSKTVLQNTAKSAMQDVADNVVKKYITKPVTQSIQNAK